MRSFSVCVSNFGITLSKSSKYPRHQFRVSLSRICFYNALLRALAELHDYMGAEKGRTLGMPVDEFIDAAMAGLLSDKDQIVIGSVGPVAEFDDIVNNRRRAFENLAKILKGGIEASD
jgi:hypothetical protein